MATAERVPAYIVSPDAVFALLHGMPYEVEPDAALAALGPGLYDRDLRQLSELPEDLDDYDDLLRDADWEEGKHPRGRGGRFAAKGGGALSALGHGSREEDPAPALLPEPTEDGGLRQWLDLLVKAQASSGLETTPARFQADNGRLWPFDDASFEGKKGPAHQCYMNAGRAALHGAGDLTYVEGFVSIHGVPIAHAWTVDRRGHVVDPTIHGPAKDVRAYHGVPVRTEYLRKTVLRTRTWGVMQHDNIRRVLADGPNEVVERSLLLGKR